MYRSKKAFRVAIILLTAILFILSFQLLCLSPPTADAVFPSSYTDNVSGGGLDWQAGEEYLDITAVKAEIESWFGDASYDFDAVEPIVIAVVDTGVNVDHELFEGRYDADGNKIVSSSIGSYDVLFRNEDGSLICKNSATGSSAAYGVADTTSNGHGTHVAGIIAELIHYLDLEKFIKIMPVKASSGNTANFSFNAVKDGIEFAVEQGADVVNMSFGAEDKAWADVISPRVEDKALFVAAAGNGGPDKMGDDSAYPKYRTYPAASENVIAAMNYERTAEGGALLSDSSNYGSHYDLCAPGTAIFSSDSTDEAGYKTLSGTSMAAPVLSFAGALLLLKYRAFEKTSDYSVSYADVGKMLRTHPDSYIVKKNYELPMLDLLRLIEIDFLTDSALGLFVDDVRPLSIRLEADAAGLIQILGYVKETTLNAVLYPENTPSSFGVEWYASENGKERKIGEGSEISYKPPETVGSYVLTAKVRNSDLTASKTVVVNNVVLDPASSVIVTDGGDESVPALKRDNSLTLTIKDSQFANPSNTSIIWYVNGNYAHAGRIFRFTAEESGSFRITAAVNGRVISDDFTIDVKWSPRSSTGYIVLYAVLAAIFLVVVATSIVIAVKHGRNKRAKNRLR